MAGTPCAKAQKGRRGLLAVNRRTNILGVSQPRVTRPAPEEDELDELPPMDGEDVEEEGAEGEDLDEEPMDGGDPMDDSTGEDEPLEEIEVAGAESGWLDDAGESDGLDVGTPETFGAEEESPTLLEGAEEPEAGEDEVAFGVGAEGDSLVGDAGEEGFEDEEEDLREEDLPRLDSGQDDTESDDADLLDGLPDDEVSEEPRPPWDDRAWERVEGGTELAAVEVIACSPDGLIVGAQGLARMGRNGEGLTPLEAVGLRGAARGLAVLPDALFASTRSSLFASEDSGKTFKEANGWRALFEPSEGEGALEIVSVAGDLRGRGAGGAVVWSGDRGESWSRVLPDYRFEAIAADASRGEVVLLAREATATTIARGSKGKLVVSSTGVLPSGKTIAVVAHNGQLAVALGRGAFRTDEAGVHDGGDTTSGVPARWTRLEGTAGLTAMTFARGDGTLLIALDSEAEGRAWILEARAGAPALTVAEMGDSGSANEEGDEVRVRALCWDAAAGVVWAAGGFGLVALRPARR